MAHCSSGFLTRRESASHPARGCLTAIFRARVEGDDRLRGRTMNGVDHRFKQHEPIPREADTCADHYTVVNVAGQEAFNRRNCGLVGFDKAVLRMPAPPCEIGQREFDPSVDLLRGHARWQRRVRKVHRRRIKTDKQDTCHRTSKALIAIRPSHSTRTVRGISLTWPESTRGRRQASPRRSRHERRTLATSTRPTPKRLTCRQEG